MWAEERVVASTRNYRRSRIAEGFVIQLSVVGVYIAVFLRPLDSFQWIGEPEEQVHRARHTATAELSFFEEIDGVHPR